MIRFELKLLPVKEGTPAAEAKIIEEANAIADLSYKHLKKLLGNRKCRKHPSSPNKLRVYAVKGKGPEVEMIAYCCQDFVKTLK